MSPYEIEGAMERAIQSVLDGTADEETGIVLAKVLKSDPAAREIYYEHAELHQALSTRFSHGSPVATATILANFRLRSQMRRTGIVALISAAAVVALSAVILHSVLAPEHGQKASIEPAAGTRMTVSRSGAEVSPEEISEGALVQLEQGSVELKFNHGSRALILAPATFDFQSRDTLRLQAGTGWFRIEEADQGFKVLTQELEVTDLGTEFGVISTPDESDQVHVFKGRVLAKNLNGNRKTEELSAGDSRLSDPVGRLVPMPSQPWSFLVRLPESASDGLIVNGGFESGETPPDATFGVEATPSYLPGWRFGKEITVVRATSEGRPGYGAKDITILSSTADVQVGFNANTVERPTPKDVSIYQTFATVPGREYEVRFEMGGIFFSRVVLKVAATVRDGTTTGGDILARHLEKRPPSSGHGYNPPTSFRFKAASPTTTLSFTEVSSSTFRADPVIDNISVKEVH